MKPLIVVCTDFSPCSNVALARAADIARRNETRVFLVHIFDPGKVRRPATLGPAGSDDRSWDEESMHQLREARYRYFGYLADSDVQYDALPGSNAALEICRVAKDTRASLIVVGSHGRTGMLRRLLGSVAEAIVRHAPCSVYVVRDEPVGAT
jgi:nucleotide-binding universal stress UspA family protein